VNQLLVQFSYLQVLDFMTTVAFLVHGVREGNPLVRLAIQYSPHPMTGLLLVKVIALALAFYCWKFERTQVLTRMNIMFAIVVAWNLVALILAAGRMTS